MTATTCYFTEEEVATLDPAKIPQHVVIVPDGNRRWAQSHSETTAGGHRNGADSLMDIIRAAKELKIKVVTVYAFSTENWKRDPDEVNALMWLFKTYLQEECAEMIEGGVRFDTIGDPEPMPAEVRETIAATKAATAHCDQITMVLALNYGARDEIRRALAGIVDEYSKGQVEKEDITETLIASRLDTAKWPEPELYIRTSGEMRISNCLLWQLSYAELYFTEVLWPDFRPQHLLEAVSCFQNRKRRLGS